MENGGMPELFGINILYIVAGIFIFLVIDTIYIYRTMKKFWWERTKDKPRRTGNRYLPPRPEDEDTGNT